MVKLPIISTHWPFSKYRRMARFKTILIRSLTKFFILVFAAVYFTSCKKIECKPEPQHIKLPKPIDKNPQIPNIIVVKGGHNGN